MAISGHHPRMQYPRIPGHEVIGVVDALGQGVDGWQVGERIGVGWRAGPHDVTGLTVDGGYAEYMVALADAAVHINAAWDAAVMAPLLCAGVTTFSALTHSAARPGDVVAILGIGGLGHLALQISHKSGYRTVAVSHSPQKAQWAKTLGAHEFIDVTSGTAVQALRDLGGARVILATAPQANVISQLFGGLAHNGELITVVGGSEPISVLPGELLGRRLSIRGWRVDDPRELPASLRFSELAGITPRVETFPLQKADSAFHRMLNAEILFRAVLVP
jgi:propanol-preferring alcohol dehydrogenase